MKESRNAVWLLLAAAFLWSWGGVLIKGVEWNPIALAAGRGGVAAITMWLWLRRPKWTFSLPQIAAGISCAVSMALFIAATKMTTAANAIFLQYTSPIYIALLAWWLLKEKIDKWDVVFIPLSLIGIGMFFMDRLTPGNFFGNVLAIACGVFVALTAVFLRMQKNGSPTESLLMGNLIIFVVGLPFMIHDPMPKGLGWTGVVIMGTLQLGLPYILYAQAMKHIKALEANLILMIEPIMNPLWVMILLGERPQAWAMVGAAIVLVISVTRGVLSARE